MGRPKQLLPFGGTTVLGRVIDTAVASRLNRVVVVVGSYHDEIVGHLQRDDVEFLTNSDPDQGNLSSLLVASCEVAPAPILLLMGDMPGLNVAVIDAHLDMFEESPAWLRVTEYSDRRGHPLMLSSELVAQLDALEGPKVLWRLTTDERTRSLAVGESMPVDIDTPADYRGALERGSPN
jgi:molybdenum cofactor cytidylyltransferase